MALVVAHADVDAMFAQVHQLDDPTLVGMPVLVGGTGPRAVVAAASVEAKRLGVRSAMAMSQALRLCRNSVVVVKPDGARYRAASRTVMDALATVAHEGLVEPASIDEAYLRLQTDRPQQAAEAAVAAVRASSGLSVSVGASTTKLGAKLLSAWVKKERGPGSAAWMGDGELVGWMADLPVDVLPGCGPVTSATLAGIGVRTVADLRDADEHLVARTIGKASAGWLTAAAQNRDPRQVERPGPSKQASHERTYEADVADFSVVVADVEATARKVAAELAAAGRYARTGTVKLRTGDFQDLSRSRTLPAATDDPEVLARLARELVGQAWEALGRQPVRLVGFAASGLSEVAQPSLFLEGPE